MTFPIFRYMNHYLRLVTAAIVLAFPIALRAESPVEEYGHLRVEGAQLVDESGSPVVLRGVSLGWHIWWPRFYTAGTVSWVADDWGVDIIRAPIGIGHDNDYLERREWGDQLLYRVVDGAIAKGIYVIVDWHSHDIHLEEAKSFFSKVAEKYGEYPNIIYEIFNEPDDESWEEVKAYSEEVIESIRAFDPDNLIIVGSPNWDQDVHLVADNPIVGHENIVYSLHYYAATHGESLMKRGDYALGEGVGLFISESAGMEASGDGALDLESWKKWRDWAEERKISWITWSVTDKDETCSFLKRSASSLGNWAPEDMNRSAILTREILRGFAGLDE